VGINLLLICLAALWGQETSFVVGHNLPSFFPCHPVSRPSRDAIGFGSNLSDLPHHEHEQK